MRHPLAILLMLFAFATSAGGQAFNAGLMPEVSLSYKWSDRIQQTIKIESSQAIYSSGGDGFYYKIDQTDFQFFLAGRLNPLLKVAGGYQFRLDVEGDHAHRFIQQAGFLQRGAGYRLGHRIRTDQTLYISDPLKIRFRYRLSAEVPLQGQSLDNRELYLLLSGEPILSFQASEAGLETRFTSALGFQLSNKTKFELGLDYRLEELFTNSLDQNFWITIGWFYAIAR